jgi:hypothetical protein
MPSLKKLEQVILYVADKLEVDRDFGRTKLAKVLYHSDFMSYRLYKEPITGWDYVKMPYGPMPNDYLTILNAMEENRSIATKEEAVIDYPRKRILAIHQPNLKLLSARDIQVIDRVIQELHGKTANTLSEESHGVAYKLVEMQQIIPYPTSVFSDEKPTDDELAEAERIARELSLE